MNRAELEERYMDFIWVFIKSVERVKGRGSREQEKEQRGE